MIGLAIWQGILDGLGWLLAQLYSFIPNYGVAIIFLTILIRLLLLPLGIKQVRSMQAMASLQPKLNAIKQKYKGNRQKQMEEQQKIMREAGVNPLAGCLPVLLQLPVLIALYAVLRFPANVGAYPEGTKPPLPHSHIPRASRLYHDILAESPRGVHFAGTNLLCSALQAGKEVPLEGPDGHAFVNPQTGGRITTLDCGRGIPVRIPYYLLALLMVGTTFYQQRQMQRASPGPAQPQQQMLTRIMPLLFGVWGVLFPAGLVVYWTTSNLWQIGQQHFMLRAGRGSGAGDAAARPAAKPQRKGLLTSMMERAQQEQERRRNAARGGSSGTSSTAGSTKSSGDGSGTGRGITDSRPSGNPAGARKPGGKNAGSRKKRRKR